VSQKGYLQHLLVNASSQSVFSKPFIQSKRLKDVYLVLFVCHFFIYTSSLEEIVSAKFILTIVILASTLSGCNLVSSENGPAPVSAEIPTLEFASPTPIQPISPSPLSPNPSIPSSGSPLSIQQAVIDLAFTAIAAIDNRDMTILASYVHPQMGLRFSPYAFVSDTDLVFPADKIAGLLTDSTVYTWGMYSGSGASIDRTFADFFSQFIYDEDFDNAPQISLNNRLGVSTSLDNIFEFYTSSMFVEFHFPGFDPQYESMDWRSLRLVFTQYNSAWYLVGIIHDQWTT
jgi:hypothetical protein